MPEEKVQFGLQNVRYATYTEANGIITFDTPIAIPGAVEMTNEPLGDPIRFYADNMVFYSADNNQGYEGTLSIARLPDSFKTSVLGEELEETDKVLAEYADAQTKPFALLFEFLNDKKARRHVMFNCSARRPSISSATKTDSVEPSVTELTYNATPIIMGARPIVKVSTTQDTTAAVYDSWFDSVYQSTP